MNSAQVHGNLIQALRARFSFVMVWTFTRRPSTRVWDVACRHFIISEISVRRSNCDALSLSLSISLALSFLRSSPGCWYDITPLKFTDCYLTIKPLALEGKGSNCFSITQLVGPDTYLGINKRKFNVRMENLHKECISMHHYYLCGKLTWNS